MATSERLVPAVPPRGTASLFVSCVTLCKTIIGAGVLSLPFALRQTGLVLGLVLLLLCGACQAYVLHLVAVCVKEQKQRGAGGANPTYYSLALAAGLSPVLVEGAICVACFGFATSYLIVMGDLAPQITAALVHSPPHAYAQLGADGRRRAWIALLGGGLGLPLMLLRSLKKLSFTSVIGTAGIVYVLAITVAIACGLIPAGAMAAKPGFHWQLGFPHVDGRGNYVGALSVLSIYVFAYSCTQALPPIMAEMRDASLQNVDLLITISIAFCTLMYAGCAVAGYVAYGSQVGSDLLKFFPSSGVVSTVARLAIVIRYLPVEFLK